MQDLRYNTLATGNDLEMLGDSNFCCKNKMEVGPPLILLSLCYPCVLVQFVAVTMLWLCKTTLFMTLVVPITT